LGSEASKLIQVEDFVEITTTFPDDLIADDIAEALVRGGLVAYEVPEITARRIEWVTEDYAQWLVQSTTPGIDPT
jgi:uncharacterized protein involved in tolerance to divalent cations